MSKGLELNDDDLRAYFRERPDMAAANPEEAARLSIGDPLAAPVPSKLSGDDHVDAVTPERVAELATMIKKGRELLSQRGGASATPSKYHAERTEYNGIRYDSKREARYAAELTLRVQAGEIKGFIVHVPFHLPGGAVHRVDFGVMELDGRVSWVEVKGKDLPMGKLKRRQVEDLFGIVVEVVT